MDVWQILATFPMNPNNGTQKMFKIVFFMFSQGTNTMSFQMFPQIACKSRCIVALAAIAINFPPLCAFKCLLKFPACEHARLHWLHLLSVWRFPGVGFQMCPQIACLSGCIITLVAFVWLFTTMHFEMCPQRAYDAKSHWLHLFNFSPVCVFKCDLKTLE